MRHASNVAKAQNYRVPIFFHKTTAFTHTMYFFMIQRIGFRRIGTEPFWHCHTWWLWVWWYDCWRTLDIGMNKSHNTNISGRCGRYGRCGVSWHRWHCYLQRPDFKTKLWSCPQKL